MNYTIYHDFGDLVYYDYTDFVTPDVCLEIQKTILDNSIIPIIHKIAIFITVLIVLFLVYIVIKRIKKK